MLKFKYLAFAILLLAGVSLSVCYPAPLAPCDCDFTITACFTPGQDCTSQIISNINDAKTRVYVQAYGFTTYSIASALINAARRGADIQIIMDKSNLSSCKSVINYLKQHNVPIYIDYKPAIAHNKVIVIDDDLVITGSFNFTNSAQNKNAENLVIIKDLDINKQYYQYWFSRKIQSRRIN